MKIKKVLPKVLLLLLVLTIASSFFSKVKAQTYEDYLNAINQGNGNYEQFGKAGNDGGIYYLRSILAGTDPTTMEPTSLLGISNNFIASLYSNPPASGIYYAYDLIDNFGGKNAYAQGVGFSSLEPILPIWKGFRNATYILFAIVFIAVGIGIIFRIKISPQAIISIESALPKMIGALILVTFSYAIAGFLIDLLYVLMALGVSILNMAGVSPGLFNVFGFPVFPATANNVIRSGFFAFAPALIMKKGVTILGGIIGGLLGGLTGTIVGVGIGAFAFVVLFQVIWLIIALILIIKLIFALTQAYINIILAVIFAPIQILVGAIPGFESNGFGKWFKNLFTEILIFPAVLIVLMIGVFISQNTISTLWIPPLISGPSFTGDAMSGSLSALIIQSIIGIGFLLLLPNVPNIVRKAMGKEDSGYGTMIGKNLSPGPVATMAASATGSNLTHAYQADPTGVRKSVLVGHTVAQALRSIGFMK